MISSLVQPLNTILLALIRSIFGYVRTLAGTEAPGFFVINVVPLETLPLRFSLSV